MPQYFSRIALCGCDDTTYLDVRLTPSQCRLVEALAALSLIQSEYGCQPVMKVEHIALAPGQQMPPPLMPGDRYTPICGSPEEGGSFLQALAGVPPKDLRPIAEEEA